MAQHDYVIANASGATVRADINSMALAISSNNSGSSEPATKYAYEFWVDSGNNLIKLRNGANNAWITLPFSTTASNTVDVNGGSIDGTPIGASSASTGAFTTITGTSATLTTSGTDDPLTLAYTGAAANVGPVLKLYRNSGSAADSDATGEVRFIGKNDAGSPQDVNYAQIITYIEDATDGTEDGAMYIKTMLAGTARNTISLLPSAVVINDESQDVDFRVESDGNANMLFVDGGNNRVGIGTASPETLVEISGAVDNGLLQGLQLTNTDYAANETGQKIAINFKLSRAGTMRDAARITAGKDSDFDDAASVDSYLAFDTALNDARTEKMRIDSSGNVGIGTELNLERTLTLSTGLAKTSTSSASVFAIQSNEASVNSRFSMHYTGGASAADRKIFLQMEEDGVANAGQIHLNPSGGTVHSPQGIIFGTATTAAETLDDYEEGNWTPTIISTGGSTPNYATSLASGTYTKIGNTVCASFIIVVSGVTDNGGAGNKAVTGLPFSQTGSTYAQNGVIGYNDVWADAVQAFYITGANLQIIPTGVTQSNYTGVITTGYFSGTITYKTAT